MESAERGHCAIGEGAESHPPFRSKEEGGGLNFAFDVVQRGVVRTITGPDWLFMTRSGNYNPTPASTVPAINLFAISRHDPLTYLLLPPPPPSLLFSFSELARPGAFHSIWKWSYMGETIKGSVSTLPAHTSDL